MFSVGQYLQLFALLGLSMICSLLLKVVVVEILVDVFAVYEINVMFGLFCIFIAFS